MTVTPLGPIEAAFATRPDRLLRPTDADYRPRTATWAQQKHQRPQLLVRPQTTSELQELVALLYAAEPALDFAVRNGGIGSASSHDVLVSLDHFKELRFDAAEEVLYVGAGALWEDVDRYMQTAAPGWAVVSSRTPCVGVAGIVTAGGISWLSHEFGLVSDPDNLLDVQVVLADGRHVWAAETDPDLLWSMRAGKSVFGVMTQLKLRARQLKTTGLFSGQIRFPLDKLDEVSAALSAHVERNHDPKVAFHCFILNPKSPFFESPPGIAIMVYDGHGVAHGRGPQGFQWALEIDGAEDQTVECSLYDVNEMSAHSKHAIGLAVSHDVSALVTDIDPGFIARASAWWDKVLATNERFASGSYCLLEGFQRAVYDSSRGATAWPHAGHKHVLQLGVGFVPDPAAPDLTPLCYELLHEAFAAIPHTPCGRGDFAPTFWEPAFMDLDKVYAGNVERLWEVAKRYDPKRRFRSVLYEKAGAP